MNQINAGNISKISNQQIKESSEINITKENSKIENIQKATEDLFNFVKKPNENELFKKNELNNKKLFSNNSQIISKQKQNLTENLELNIQTELFHKDSNINMENKINLLNSSETDSNKNEHPQVFQIPNKPNQPIHKPNNDFIQESRLFQTKEQPQDESEKNKKPNENNELLGKTRSANEFLNMINHDQTHPEEIIQASESTNIKNLNKLFEKSTPKNFLPKKNDNQPKNQSIKKGYYCGCGNSYLSYASLYIHVKDTHQGIFPSGTTTINKELKESKHKDKWCPIKSNVDIKKSYDFNKDFIGYLDMIPGAKVNQFNFRVDILNVFPFEFFRDRVLYEPLVIKIQQLKKDLIENYGQDYLNQIDSIILEINNAKSLNCNEIFSLFLIYVYRFVSQAFFKEIVFFIVSYRLMMNKHGWNKMRENKEIDRFEYEKEFCEEQNAEFIPDFANHFILDVFSDSCRPNNILKQGINLHFLGLENIKLLRVILLIRHFNLWMYNNKFTKAKIDIYKE